MLASVKPKTFIALAAALSASLGAMLSVAAAQEAACRIELNYEDADIRTVVDEIAIRTGRYFVLDPAVQGRVTIKSPPNGGICVEEAWELFQAMLRANDFVAVPIGDMKYRIVPLQEAARSGGRVGTGGSGLELVTEIVRLRYVDSREAAANLAQIIGNSGVVSPVRSGNAIIIVDTANNVERLRKVLLELDRDPTVFRRIELTNASAGDVARVVNDLASEITDEQSGRGSFSIAPVEASNSLFVRAEPTLMTRIEGVIAELDRFGGNTSNLSVIYLNHADAEELAPLLTEVANNTPGLSSGEGAARGNRATVSFHGPTNSLIINGDAEIQRTLQNVIAKLDVRRSQVLVEAIVVAISERLERDIGFQYFLTGNGENGVPFTATNFPSGPNLLPAAGAALLRGDALSGIFDSTTTGGDTDSPLSDEFAEQALRSLLGLQGGVFGGGFEFGDGNVFGAILNAIQSDTDSNVLSTPSVLTLDNQTARLQVGQEIPITTGEQIGDDFQNAFRTVDRQEVGVILEVTPQINEGDTVTLEITQEISDIQGPITSTSTDLITNKREITTTALVDDGQILVIGGLIDEELELKSDKIPFLGDVPGLGALFRSNSRESNRSNLMVFIRPTIIRDQQTAELATTKKLDYIRARELLRSGSPQSDIDRMIDQVTGINRPDQNNNGPSPTVDGVE